MKIEQSLGEEALLLLLEIRVEDSQNMDGESQGKIELEYDIKMNFTRFNCNVELKRQDLSKRIRE